MEIEVATPKPVAKRANGELVAEAQAVCEQWKAWADGKGLPVTQAFLSVRGIVKTCIGNGVPRNNIAIALGNLTRAGQVVTSQSMANALLAQQRNGAGFRKAEDQQWFEESLERASERDAAGGGAW